MSSPTPLPEKSSPVTKPFSENCWSCRILSGGGLLASGAYVYMQAQKFKHLRGPTSMGTVAQIIFAAGEIISALSVMTYGIRSDFETFSLQVWLLGASWWSLIQWERKQENNSIALAAPILTWNESPKPHCMMLQSSNCIPMYIQTVQMKWINHIALNVFLFATYKPSFFYYTMLVQNIIIAYKVHKLDLWISWLLHYNLPIQKSIIDKAK